MWDLRPDQRTIRLKCARISNLSLIWVPTGIRKISGDNFLAKFEFEKLLRNTKLVKALGRIQNESFLDNIKLNFLETIRVGTNTW